MSLTEQFRFMFTTLHSGAVNFTLHLASIPVLLMGLAQRRVGWIIVAAAMEVAGHAWNWFFRFDRQQRRNAVRVFPLQASLTVVVFLLLFLGFGWL